MLFTFIFPSIRREPKRRNRKEFSGWRKGSMVVQDDQGRWSIQYWTQRQTHTSVWDSSDGRTDWRQSVCTVYLVFLLALFNALLPGSDVWQPPVMLDCSRAVVKQHVRCHVWLFLVVSVDVEVLQVVLSSNRLPFFTDLINFVASRSSWFKLSRSRRKFTCSVTVEQSYDASTSM